MLIRIKLVSYY